MAMILEQNGYRGQQSAVASVTMAMLCTGYVVCWPTHGQQDNALWIGCIGHMRDVTMMAYLATGFEFYAFWRSGGPKRFKPVSDAGSKLAA